MRKDHSLVARLAAGTGAALLAASLLADAAIAEPDMSKVVQVAEKMNEVGGKALQDLTGKRKDATVILSPYGLGSALHLLMLGASGGSPAERSLKGRLVPSAFKKLSDARENLVVLDMDGDKIKLKSANAVFVPASSRPAQGSKFKSTAETVLKARVEALDFNTPKALETVNAWVKTETKGEIPSILEKLEPDARFVILNAVYFKGAWELAFDPARTAKAPFTRADGSKREDVPMMSATFPVQLTALGELQAIWLPYAGKNIAMVVFAPRTDGAPTLVADTLKTTSIDKLIAAASKEAEVRPVHVRLPRFRSESFLDITDALAGQIGPALAANSEYGPINDGKKGPLMVVHRVVVDVTEEGTVAAAATGITNDRSLAVTPVFAADRPFAFAIVHRPTHAVLFTGYIADPGAGS